MVAASQTIPWFAQILTTSLTTNLPQVTAGGNLELFALRPLGSAASLRLLVHCLGGNNSRGIGPAYDWFSREELGKQKMAPSQNFELDVLTEAQGFPGRLLEVSTSMKLRQRPQPQKRVEARQEIVRELEAKYPRPRPPVDAASGVPVPPPQPVVPVPLVVPSVAGATTTPHWISEAECHAAVGTSGGPELHWNDLAITDEDALWIGSALTSLPVRMCQLLRSCSVSVGQS